MTSLPGPSDGDHWLLEITIETARADDANWQQQVATLRSIASYDPATKTWGTFIDALDPPSMIALNTLFEAARTFGTKVRLAPARVPAGWAGASFTGDHDMTALLKEQTDQGRPLGQLPF
ncbi:hypothetical protein ABT124_40560 [Streptomyces sp. NPDC001982]|uniref:hypothetical protein n=1 Tax=Streptomyces sp. NPDC001982 TaxID=3154405 RepID=UPI003321D393